MELTKLPYVKYLVSPLGELPEQHIYRPVIPVKLSFQDQEITFDGLIDSGADQCTFPGWIAETLGHNVEKGQQRKFFGIGGSATSFLHKAHLSIGKDSFLLDIYYSHDWDNLPLGLLGQAGFFSHYDIELSYSKKEIRLNSIG